MAIRISALDRNGLKHDFCHAFALHGETSVLPLILVVLLLMLHPDVEVPARHTAIPIRKCGEQQRGWQLHFSKAVSCLPSLGGTRASQAHLF